MTETDPSRKTHTDGLLLTRGELDDHDRLIVEILQADGRLPVSQIAAKIGIAEKTARRRLKHLIENQVIHITAVTSPEALGYRAIALVGIELDGTKSASDIAILFAALPASDYVVVATGRFPIYVELYCRDLQELATTIDRDIRGADGVRTAETFLYLSLHYQQAHFAQAQIKNNSGTAIRPVELGELDRSIIAELTRDGRTPFLHIGSRLGISETQVRQRVATMRENGAARVIAIVNPLALGYQTTAWLAITVGANASAAAVAELLSPLSAVTYVAICSGRCDIFAEIACRSEAELLQLVDRDIRGIDGIAHLEIAVYLDLHYKRLLPAAVGR